MTVFPSVFLYKEHFVIKVSTPRRLEAMDTTIYVLMVVALMGLVCEGIPNTDYPKVGDYNTYGGDNYQKSGYHTTGGYYRNGQTHHGGSYYQTSGYHGTGKDYYHGQTHPGGSYYPTNGYPHGGPNNPFPGYPPNGPNYPFPGYPPYGSDLNLPQGCNSIRCFAPACQVESCRNFPQAQCFGFCGGCVARFFVGGVNVTPFCGGSTIPGRPHKKY